MAYYDPTQSSSVTDDWMDWQARLGFPLNLNVLANVTDEYGRRRKCTRKKDK